MLELINISKGFWGEDGFRPVLNSVSLTIGKGEMVTLLGRSGSGKTTLLRIASGHEAPDSGQVLLEGAAVSKPSVDRFVVFQTFDQLFPWQSVRRNLIFALRSARNMPQGEAAETADHWLEQTGLAGSGGQLPHELSGGMKQRAALARAFALSPKVLLLDEPFAGLDAVLRESMQRLLLDLCRKQQCSVLFVTHDIEEALLLSPQPAILRADGSGIARILDSRNASAEIHQLLEL